MTFQDIFNSYFLESTTDLSAIQISITLLLSLLVGLFIF